MPIVKLQPLYQTVSPKQSYIQYFHQTTPKKDETFNISEQALILKMKGFLSNVKCSVYQTTIKNY